MNFKWLFFSSVFVEREPEIAMRRKMYLFILLVLYFLFILWSERDNMIILCFLCAMCMIKSCLLQSLFCISFLFHVTTLRIRKKKSNSLWNWDCCDHFFLFSLSLFLFSFANVSNETLGTRVHCHRAPNKNLIAKLSITLRARYCSIAFCAPFLIFFSSAVRFCSRRFAPENH